MLITVGDSLVETEHRRSIFLRKFQEQLALKEVGGDILL